MKILLSIIYFFICLMAAQTLRGDNPFSEPEPEMWLKILCAFIVLLPLFMAFGLGFFFIDKMDEYRRKLIYKSMAQATFAAVLVIMFSQVFSDLFPNQIIPNIEIVPSVAMIWFFLNLELLEKKRLEE